MGKKCVISLISICACQAQWLSSPLDELRRELVREQRTVTDIGITTDRAADFDANGAASPSADASISATRLMHKAPKAARKLFADANRLSKKGDHAHAIEALRSATRHDSEFADAWDQLAVEYSQLHQFTEAAAALRRSLEIDAYSWLPHYNLAICLYRIGDATGAVEHARLALRESGGTPITQWFLGFVLYQHKETQTDGLRYLQSAAQTMPEAREFLRTLK